MRRKTIEFFSSTALLGLAFILSACNLSSALATPDYTATELSLLSKQRAVMPAFTATLPVSPTPSPAPTIPITPTNSLPTQGPRPSSYTLQAGEFPYCIARRFNIDPKELVALNHLGTQLTYAPGMVLIIPQTGHPFPIARALRPHPTTFTVPESQMTVYKVACYFGDVEPAAIIQYNRLASPILTMGQALQIP
jgi:LysM repeat protein